MLAHQAKQNIKQLFIQITQIQNRFLVTGYHLFSHKITGWVNSTSTAKDCNIYFSTHFFHAYALKWPSKGYIFINSWPSLCLNDVVCFTLQFLRTHRARGMKYSPDRAAHTHTHPTHLMLTPGGNLNMHAAGLWEQSRRPGEMGSKLWLCHLGAWTFWTFLWGNSAPHCPSPCWPRH